MSARISISWLAAWIFFIGCGVASAIERAYWVWQRSEPLAEAESVELRRQEVSTLYWHVATVNEQGAATAHAQPAAALAPGFHVVPVVRVEMKRLPAREVFLRLARFAEEGALQLDFDVPDSKLGAYAALLAELRAKVPHLGITALAHWPQVPEFPELARSVEELCPMFYDLQKDPTGVSAEAPPPPILDAASAKKLLESWKSCPVRWRAGLPTFSRLTIFDGTGLSRGQIPAWDWDDVVFHPHLHTLAPTRLGVTLLRADAALLVARRPMEKDEILAVRTTDGAELAACVEAVKKSGAAGMVFYRLPAKESATTKSLQALGSDAAAPRLTLQREGDQLVLRNEGGADLVPRLAGERNDRDRGYALEIDARAPVFREAEPGAFFRVSGHVDPDGKPMKAGTFAATRLTFWFSRLDAGARLASGLFQLAPGADPGALRWRLAGGDWQPLLLP